MKIPILQCIQGTIGMHGPRLLQCTTYLKTGLAIERRILKQLPFTLQNFVLIYAGKPSPPDNLRGAIAGDTLSVAIEWDPPVYAGGNGISILMYRITIPETDYEEESNTTRSHTITADSTNVMFNIPYVVEVTAINTCGDESAPASQTIIIEAIGKNMHCVVFVLNCIST